MLRGLVKQGKFGDSAHSTEPDSTEPDCSAFFNEPGPAAVCRALLWRPRPLNAVVEKGAHLGPESAFKSNARRVLRQPPPHRQSAPGLGLPLQVHISALAACTPELSSSHPPMPTVVRMVQDGRDCDALTDCVAVQQRTHSRSAGGSGGEQDGQLCTTAECCKSISGYGTREYWGSRSIGRMQHSPRTLASTQWGSGYSVGQWVLGGAVGTRWGSGVLLVLSGAVGYY
jgi:hypothetical protein